MTGRIALSPDDRTAADRAHGRPGRVRRPRLGRRAARAGRPPGSGPAARLQRGRTHGGDRRPRQPDPALGRRAADDPGDVRRPLRADHRAGLQPRRPDALQQRARRQDHALGRRGRAPARPSVRARGRGRRPRAEPRRPDGRGRARRRDGHVVDAADAADALAARRRRRRSAASPSCATGRLLATRCRAPPVAVRIRRRGRSRQRPRSDRATPNSARRRRRASTPAGDGWRSSAAARRWSSRWRPAVPPDARATTGGAGGALNVALSPDGRSLAVTTKEGIEIVDVDRMRLRSFLIESATTEAPPQFSPDGRLLAAGSREGWVRLWSTRDAGSPSRPSSPPTAAPCTRSRSAADGRTLASGGTDGTRPPLRHRDAPAARRAAARRRRAARRLRCSRSTARTCSRSPPPQAASAGTYAPRRGCSRACNVAGRTLTRAEWTDVLPARDYAPACTS